MNDGPKKGLDAVLAVIALAGYAAFVFVAFVGPRFGAAQAFSGDGAETATATSAATPSAELQLATSERALAERLASGPPDFTPPMEILIKFEGDRGERLRDLYLEDPARAKAAFAEFAAGREAFKDLELKLMSFDGEATLVYTGPAPDGIPARTAMQREIAQKLRAIAGVSRAEPNLIAGLESD